VAVPQQVPQYPAVFERKRTGALSARNEYPRIGGDPGFQLLQRCTAPGAASINIQNDTGTSVLHPSEAGYGGFPTVAGSRPCADAHHGGMPDVVGNRARYSSVLSSPDDRLGGTPLGLPD
jgi:hypothetical protein